VQRFVPVTFLSALLVGIVVPTSGRLHRSPRVSAHDCTRVGRRPHCVGYVSIAAVVVAGL